MSLQRRHVLAALAALSFPAARAADDRASLVQAGERALAAGDPDAALLQFERVASLGHEADTEMRIVRAHMQAGAYRQALALSAHMVGEHHDEAGPPSLYAWLLDAGGQREVAQRVLKDAPASPLVAQTRQALATSPRQPSALMQALPHRMAPVAVDGVAALPASARVACTGALLPDGRHALVPASAVGDNQALWLRNGLGQRSSARMDQVARSLGVALLRLDTPLPVPAQYSVAARDPFAGSPATTVGYAGTSNADAAWPCLHAGFLGAFLGGAAGRDTPLRRLGITVPADLHGAPLYDAVGRFAGLSLQATTAGAEATWVPVSALREAFADALGSAAEGAPPRRMPYDESYERALRGALQLIVG